jgi:hypothetical protein
MKIYDKILKNRQEYALMRYFFIIVTRAEGEIDLIINAIPNQ